MPSVSVSKRWPPGLSRGARRETVRRPLDPASQTAHAGDRLGGYSQSKGALGGSDSMHGMVDAAARCRDDPLRVSTPYLHSFLARRRPAALAHLRQQRSSARDSIMSVRSACFVAISRPWLDVLRGADPHHRRERRPVPTDLQKPRRHGRDVNLPNLAARPDPHGHRAGRTTTRSARWRTEQETLTVQAVPATTIR